MSENKRYINAFLTKKLSQRIFGVCIIFSFTLGHIEAQKKQSDNGDGTYTNPVIAADFPDPDNFLFTLFHSQSPNNVGNYQNPEVDRLLELARRENDYFQRLQVYRQAEALITADAPTVNLVYATFEHLFQPYVRGIALNALGERYIPMKKIWLDKTHHVLSNLAQSQ